MQKQIFGDCNSSAHEEASYCHKLHRLLEHCMQQIVIVHQQLKTTCIHDQHAEVLQQRLQTLQERRRFYQTQLINLDSFSDFS
jgi:hypothetical protein